MSTNAKIAERGTTLVIGAGGKTGRRVTDRLIAAGHRVRPASRSGKTRFDWGDQATWTPAVAGVDAAYITKSGDESYAVGQRLVVRENAVLKCLDLIEKLATGLTSDSY